MCLRKKTLYLAGLIILPLLTTVLSKSCQKADTIPLVDTTPVVDTVPMVDTISTKFEIVKVKPSKHNYNDGSIEVKFLDPKFEPEVKWSKDALNGYREVSSEYTAQSLSNGMYLLEIVRDPDSSIFETVFLATYDTIFPGDYFPIHPGSYWIYDNSDTIECFDEYSLIGLGHRYTGISQTFNPQNGYPVDSIYVPSIHVSSMDRDFDFYHYSMTFGSYLMRFLPIVDEEEGFYIKQWPDGRYDYNYNSLEILKVDTSLYIGNTLYESVIVAEHFNMPNLIGGREYSFITKKLYFSKNIGLIKGEVYFPKRVDGKADIDTVTINLAEYYIKNN